MKAFLARITPQAKLQAARFARLFVMAAAAGGIVPLIMSGAPAKVIGAAVVAALEVAFRQWKPA